MAAKQQGRDGVHNQRARILRLLLDAHGGEVPLPEILALGIAQYGARLYELRRLGFTITNRTETVDGVRHSWFRLIKGKSDWYTEATGKPRATASAPDFGPLFSGGSHE